MIQKQIFNKNDQIVKYVLKNIMPLSLILLCFTSLLIYFVLKENKNLILFATVIVSFGLFDKTTAILNSKLKFKQLRYIELYTKILLLLYALIMINLDSSIQTYIIGFTLVSLVIFSTRILYSWKQLRFKEFTNVNYHNIRSEGIQTSLSTSYTILANWSEKFILGMIDTVSLSILVIGQLFPRVIKDNIKVLLTPSLNTWASKGFNYYKMMIKRYKLFFIILGIFMFIILYFLIDIIISNFFGKYESSIIIAQLLSVTLSFKFIELILMSSIALSSHTNIFNKINNIVNSFKIVLVITLIPIFGIYGAVASILLVDTLRFYLVVYEFRKL